MDVKKAGNQKLVAHHVEEINADKPLGQESLDEAI